MASAAQSSWIYSPNSALASCIQEFSLVHSAKINFMLKTHSKNKPHLVPNGLLQEAYIWSSLLAKLPLAPVG